MRKLDYIGRFLHEHQETKKWETHQQLMDDYILHRWKWNDTKSLVLHVWYHLCLQFRMDFVPRLMHMARCFLFDVGFEALEVCI
jgi:hypothetical protein